MPGRIDGIRKQSKPVSDIQKLTPASQKETVQHPKEENFWHEPTSKNDPEAAVVDPNLPPNADDSITLKSLTSSMGPGIITGASDNDPSGIGTYSVAGAQFGFQTVWLTLVTFPLACAVQEACARIGIVTGHGLTTTIKKYYARWILAIVTLLLLIANTVNIGADIQAMAATIQLIAPQTSFVINSFAVALFTLLLLISLSYKAYSNYLKIFSLSLLGYVFVAFVSHLDWELILHSLFNVKEGLSVENLKNPTYVMTLVGILGTTISPYLFFWQSSEEVEEEVAKGMIKKDNPNIDHPALKKIKASYIKEMRIDIVTGIFYTCLTMFFIIISAGQNLFGTNANIENLDLASLANILRPLVGDTAFILFALGIIGIGMLAIPVLAGSTSYAISELFGWNEGLNKKFRDAPGFYIVIIIATLIGLALNFTGISPVAALFYTAVLNGLIAVPLLFLIWRISNNKKILGEHTSGFISNLLIFIAILIMSTASVLMFVL